MRDAAAKSGAPNGNAASRICIPSRGGDTLTSVRSRARPNPSFEENREIAIMDSALLIHRLHFAFTVTFHYLFPQLTMGLAPLIVVLKTLALRRNDEIYNQAARFWARIFGINFVLGVVTGIPMEF